MNQSKQQYLNYIRANSAYPVYRGFINTIAVLFYVLAGFYGLGAVVGGLTYMSQNFMMGMALLIGGGLIAVIVYLIARLFKEAAQIIADIGDTVIEASASNTKTQVVGQ